MSHLTTTNTRFELAMVSADIERLKLDLRDKLDERRQLIARSEWRGLTAHNDALDQELAEPDDFIDRGICNPDSPAFHPEDDGSQIIPEPDTSDPAVYFADAESQLDAIRTRRQQVGRTRRAS